jgi:hypothetical protein
MSPTKLARRGLEVLCPSFRVGRTHADPVKQQIEVVTASGAHGPTPTSCTPAQTRYFRSASAVSVLTVMVIRY